MKETSGVHPLSWFVLETFQIECVEFFFLIYSMFKLFEINKAKIKGLTLVGSGISRGVRAAFVHYSRDISRSTWLRAGTVVDLIYSHTKMLTQTH